MPHYTAPGWDPTDRPAPDDLPYRYRSLPCTLDNGTRATHSICGADRAGGAGVLEWCYGREDAERMLATMQRHMRFHSLRIGDGNGN